MHYSIPNLILIILCVIGCSKTSLIPEKPIIIPIPNELEINEGIFILDDQTTIKANSEFKLASEFITSFIHKGMGVLLTQKEGLAPNNQIVFHLDTTFHNPEGYQLQVTKDYIEIKANSVQGAFYAVQTLRQLLPPSFENGNYNKSEVAIQCVHIEDEPQFEYRGMHLDVGRHFFSVDFIKKYIDMLALLKMNTFHWHLTEDQGWRIEIKKYPKLNKIGSYRKETLIGHYNDQPHQFDNKSYGGYYTQEEVKEVVAYAEKLNITVIPEIEMPGHSQAALAAYPKLGCTEKPIEVATKWGVFEDIYCTKEETFNFLEDVLEEVITLFPSQYIHIGGDEAPKTRWKSCENCQNKIKTEGLKDEHELQSYFITRMEKYLKSRGRQIIGWDEILEGGIAPNASIMSWRGTKGAIQAAKQHHKVIMTPTSNCYFDYYQSDNENEPLAIGGFLPLKKVYNFNPIPQELTEEEAHYILGAQGNIWTEYMPTSEIVEYMMMPRAIAMSEVVWSSKKNKEYENFISRLEHFNVRLDHLEVNYANHLYEIQGKLNSSDSQHSYSLTTLTKNKTIRYSLDGTEPTINSPIYLSPIVVDKTQTIKAQLFDSTNKLGNPFEQHLNFHKAVGKKISLNVPPHKAYNAGGKEALINSIKGSDNRFGDQEWLGFWGEDVEITIDLGKITPINSISTRFFNSNGQWVYAPNNVSISFDDSSTNNNFHLDSSTDQIVSCHFTFEEIKTRFIKLSIKKYGVIPDGLQGAGNEAWTFIDELIIK